MQAVALRIAGDKAVFYKVRILGTQDTLLDDTGSHYFYQCHIQGSVDFIFGTSRSLYQVKLLSIMILCRESMFKLQELNQSRKRSLLFLANSLVFPL